MNFICAQIESPPVGQAMPPGDSLPTYIPISLLPILPLFLPMLALRVQPVHYWSAQPHSG